MSRSPFDAAFKHLGERDPRALLHLVGHATGARLELVNVELQLHRRVDFACWVDNEGRRELVHLEFERAPKADTLWRLLAYGPLLASRHRVPVTSMLILANDHPEALPLPIGARVAMEGSRRFLTGDLGSVSARFELIHMRELAGTVFAPELAEFGPLAVPPKERPAAVLRALDLLQGEEHAPQRGHLLDMARALGVSDAILLALMESLAMTSFERISVQKGRLEERRDALIALGFRPTDAQLRKVAALAPTQVLALYAGARETGRALDELLAEFARGG